MTLTSLLSSARKHPNLAPERILVAVGRTMKRLPPFPAGTLSPLFLTRVLAMMD